MNTLVMKDNNVTMKWRYFDDIELASYEDEETITVIAKFKDKEKIVQIDKVTLYPIQLFVLLYSFITCRENTMQKT